ncbi:MAG: hypothetical protein JWP61_2964 [Friedmanniella sp.]|nr:hypothetical protein [Friedmanniella sp.]
MRSILSTRRSIGTTRRGIRTTTLAVAAVTALTLGSAPLAVAGGSHDKDRSGYTFAVIGDIPYGSDQLATFPAKIAQLNADRDVRLVTHLGDIKSGSTVCSDQYFSTVRADFDQLRDPLVYTVGDNEWTDCHRPNNGGYDPLDRLTAIRRTFFPVPDQTLGQQPARVTSDAVDGYPENVRFTRDNISFAALHIVGSNNGLLPWTGHTTATPEQTAEVLGRTASTIATLHDTFAQAKQRHDEAVVLLTQADMFDPTVAGLTFADSYAFQPIVAAIARESADFGRPVYLFNGDSHVYNDDAPLAAGSRWLDLYRLGTAVPNLTRVTIDGSSNATNYLKVTIGHDRRQPLSWTRVPFTS